MIRLKRWNRFKLNRWNEFRAVFAALVVCLSMSVVVPAATASGTAGSDASRSSAHPYLGWSSWSLESTSYPGVNPSGEGTWLTEANILQQARAMAEKLKPHGYDYLNIDSRWWWDLQNHPEYDTYGRPVADPGRFPDGMAYVVDQIHRLGLKAGIYMPAGLNKDAYNNGDTPIYGAPGCHTSDIVYPDLRTTNGWDSSYKINFANPCAQKYIGSIASMFGMWGIDFMKLDGVGPGSGKSGPNYDNRPEVTAWSTALAATGRSIRLELSWSLDERYINDWKRLADSWRVDRDVECYCSTLVQWNASVAQRFDDVIGWIDQVGPGNWNNLDSLDVGNGQMDGLTDAERQTYMTLWAIEAAPLYSGDDLTKLDAYGVSLLTNDEVIAVDQAGRPAHPVNQNSDQQVWSVRNADGSYTVALFNLGSSDQSVTANLGDLGFVGKASVRDLWSHTELGTVQNYFTADLPAHGSRLLRITPGSRTWAPGTPQQVHVITPGATSVTLGWNPVPHADGYQVYEGATKVADVTAPGATIGGLNPETSYGFTVVSRNGALMSPDSGSILVTTAGAGTGLVGYQAESPINQLRGGAKLAACTGCSGQLKIGNLGKNEGTLAFPAIDVDHAGRYQLQISYVDGDAGRSGQLTINGHPTAPIAFPGSNDKNWNQPQTLTTTVDLRAGRNTIEIGNRTGNAPDLDKITLEVASR